MMQWATAASVMFHILMATAPTAVGGSGQTAAARANPIRKVVTLLQAMQKKVAAEGIKEKELYEKFQCYCNGGTKDLEASIQAAEEKVPMVSSSIKATAEKLAQLKSGLAGAKEGRDSAKDTTAEKLAQLKSGLAGAKE